MSIMESYHPSRSLIPNEVIEAFVSSDLNGALTQVPGINDDAVARFHNDGVLNVFHLLGDYMTLCSLMTNPDTGRQVVDTLVLNQKFFLYLGIMGIPVANRHSIVKAISSKAGSLSAAFVDNHTYGDDLGDY